MKYLMNLEFMQVLECIGILSFCAKLRHKKNRKMIGDIIISLSTQLGATFSCVSIIQCIHIFYMIMIYHAYFFINF